MNFLEFITKFWESVFSENKEIAYYLKIVTVILIPFYALGVLKYFDALGSASQSV